MHLEMQSPQDASKGIRGEKNHPGPQSLKLSWSWWLEESLWGGFGISDLNTWMSQEVSKSLVSGL